MNKHTQPFKFDLSAELSHIAFSTNQYHNTHFTAKTVGKDWIERHISLPTFILNALNYPILLECLQQHDHHSDHQQIIKQLHALVADPPHSATDELSYWMVDVPAEDFMPVMQHLMALDIDPASLDPKFKTSLNKMQSLSGLGINSKADYLDAMLLTQQSLPAS
ncbi:hypothetical protein [Pedobacter sp.]|uniref:hypothetical protein n=1 Tax=Pedobacter sp. TaxID=1411316 RepID=UPI003D7FA510